MASEKLRSNDTTSSMSTKYKPRTKVVIHIDTPPRAKTGKPFEVFINAIQHGEFCSEQDALDYVYLYLRDPSVKLVRLYVS